MNEQSEIEDEKTNRQSGRYKQVDRGKKTVINGGKPDRGGKKGEKDEQRDRKKDKQIDKERERETENEHLITL